MNGGQQYEKRRNQKGFKERQQKLLKDKKPRRGISHEALLKKLALAKKKLKEKLERAANKKPRS